MQSGDFAEALKMLDNVLLAEQEYKNIHYLRGICLRELGRITESSEAAKSELVLQPDHIGAKEMLHKCGDYPSVAEQPCEQKSAKELFKKGVEYLSWGEAAEALKYFNETKLNSATLPELYFALGTAYAQLGELESARKACEKQLSLQANHAGAQKLLMKINKVIKEYQQSDNKVAGA